MMAASKAKNLHNNSRHVCDVAQQPCLLCHKSDMWGTGSREGPFQTTSLVRASHPHSLHDMRCFSTLHCHIPKATGDRSPPELPVVAWEKRGCLHVFLCIPTNETVPYIYICTYIYVYIQTYIHKHSILYTYITSYIYIYMCAPTLCA